MTDAKVATPGYAAPEFPNMLPVPVTMAEPIPVKDRQPRSWTVQQIPLPVYPEQTRIASLHIARASLTVTNTGAGKVFLAPEQAACTPSTAYPLDTGKDRDMTHNAEVWATSSAPGAIASLYAEYRDG